MRERAESAKQKLQIGADLREPCAEEGCLRKRRKFGRYCKKHGSILL